MARLQLTRRELLRLKGQQSKGQASDSAMALGSPLPAAPAKSKAASRPRPVFGSDRPIVLGPGPASLLRIRLPIRLTNNNHGRGGSYHASDTFRKQCELQLQAWDLQSLPGLVLPFAERVDVHVIRVLGHRERLWDSSSGLRGNWKEIEDSLVAIGWFHDDKPQWIRHTTFDQVADDRGRGPAIVVEVRRI